MTSLLFVDIIKVFIL